VFAGWQDASGVEVREATSGPTTSVAFGSVRRLDVLRGKDPRKGLGMGALIGSGVGAVLGLLTGVVVKSSECSDEISCEMEPFLYMGGGYLIGAVIGGGIGLAASPDRWVRVDMPSMGFASEPRTPFYLNKWFVFAVTTVGLTVAGAH